MPVSGSTGKPSARQAHAGASAIHSVIAASERALASTLAAAHQVENPGQINRVRRRGRRGELGQLIQAGGHEGRRRSRHGLAK
ncbi:hypothetical protein OG786_20290 [Streptomyces sp. NBC_00101]|uniref:hypothetical protein n=1 Tax=Streptomyces sp. NBC_00101 TaxID=2975651 RepID=UPI003253BDD6